jgi:hypothetical protein
VTQQVGLLINLRGLIETNFGEIDAAVGQSTREACSGERRPDPLPQGYEFLNVGRPLFPMLAPKACDHLALALFIVGAVLDGLEALLKSDVDIGEIGQDCLEPRQNVRRIDSVCVRYLMETGMLDVCSHNVLQWYSGGVSFLRLVNTS